MPVLRKSPPSFDRKYRLSDGPLDEPEEELDIGAEVSRLLGEEVEEQYPRHASAVEHPDYGQNTSSGHSGSSYSTTPVWDSNRQYDDQYREPNDYTRGARYESFQPLPTIDSGEPLVWEDAHRTMSQHDPFRDSIGVPAGAPITRPVSQASYAPPPMPVLPFQDTRSVYTSLPDYYDPNSLSRPQSTSSYPDASFNGHREHPTPFGDSSYPNTNYETRHPTPYDDFGRDPEGIARGPNGSHSSAPYQPPRSRSPTPMADYDSMDYGYAGEKENSFANLPPSADSKLPLPDEPSRQHYGPAPRGRALRRRKTKKRVMLTNGNLVVDVDVPSKLVLPLRGRGEEDAEMKQMRYTAVTCDPDDFEKEGFYLRQNIYGRQTELFVVITMYNEDEILFCRTLHGVMRNISHLCTRKNSQTWGHDAWKKVVVCIVADGRKKIHPRVLDCLTALGVYQDGYMKACNFFNGKPVTAHLFEYTTSFGLDPNLHFRYPDKGIVPTQILFCLKEKNAKKINSHRWFFNAFGPCLQPNICVLLDVGTRPGSKSLYHLWKAFDLNSNVGGACGEIAVYKGKNWLGLLNPLVAAQNFEYKMSNILDKPTESVFGFISVLPGAFSAYRYIALQNDSNGTGPLASYFKGEVLHGRDTDIFTSNMYLAEDRILCFELVARPNADWVLKYVKPAIGETDVPDALPEFIGQRRRWLNGSFFAAVYALAHVGQLWQSGHSLGRRVAIMIQMLYNAIMLVFAWFAIGNFYLFFIILTSSLEADALKIKGIKYFNAVVQYMYAGLIVGCFLFSMGNKPKSAPWKYKITTILFAVLTIYTVVAAVICAVNASSQGGALYNMTMLSILATYGLYLAASILAMDPWHLITSFLPYLFLSPMYINVLNIYAFANLDDISWGTKQDDTPDTDLGAVVKLSKSEAVDLDVDLEPADLNGMYLTALHNLRTRKPIDKPKSGTSIAEKEQAAIDYYANVRTNVLLAWVLSNGLLLLGILGTTTSRSAFNGGSVGTIQVYMVFVLAFVAITSSVRFLGSTVYLMARVILG